MDTLTHALSGALLGRATAPRPGPATLPVGRRMAIGALAAAFPDIDFVVSYLGPVAYLYYHRGVTHSIFMLPLWALLIAWLCSLAWRRDRSWRAYYGVVALGIGAHILGDLITSFGTMIFAPFSDTRFGWGTTFIIDLWFTGILLLGLIVSGLWRRSRVPAAMGLTILVTYVGWQAALHHTAIEFGKGYAFAAGMPGARISAQPRPASPLHWMVLVEDEERIDYAFVSLSAGEPPPPLSTDAGFLARLSAPYLPLNHAIWVNTLRYGADAQDAAIAREAWREPGFDFFRWFARYPAVYRVDRGPPSTCVWFQDLRFFTPGRDRWPFRFGMCRDGDAGWRPYRLEGESMHLPVN